MRVLPLLLVQSEYCTFRWDRSRRSWFIEKSGQKLVAWSIAWHILQTSGFACGAKSVSKLQRVQNTAVRLVTRKKKYEHITPTLVALLWLPFKFRCQYKLLLYAFKALHGLAPSYLGELIHFYKPARSLRSQSAALIEMPKNARTKIYGERRFKCGGRDSVE